MQNNTVVICNFTFENLFSAKNDPRVVDPKRLDGLFCRKCSKPIDEHSREESILPRIQAMIPSTRTEVYDKAVAASPKQISAPKLKGTHFLDMFSLPPDSSVFIPNVNARKLLSDYKLLKHEFSTLSHELFCRLCKRGSVSQFCNVSSSETCCTDKISKDLLNFTMEIMGDIPHVAISSGTALRKLMYDSFNMNFKLCSAESEPEHCLLYRRFVLISSEAKGFDHSWVEAINQACQISGDAALLLRSCGIPLNNCIVPGIIVCADCVQFYVSYLIPSSFPCFAFLSPPLSFASMDDLIRIVNWMKILSQHAKDMIEMLLPNYRSYVDIDVVLDPTNFFMKPVQMLNKLNDVTEYPKHDIYPYRLILARNLYFYGLLHEKASNLEFFNFPIGICQIPDNSHRKILEVMKKTINEYFIAENVWTFQNILVFPRLSGMKSSKPDKKHFLLYVDFLKEAISSMHRCGIIHMDLRPSNILWYCDCMYLSDQCKFHLKIVDFEDSYLKGEVISVKFYVNDIRYPLFKCNKTEVAANEDLDFGFVERIIALKDASDDDFFGFVEPPVEITSVVPLKRRLDG